MPGMKELGQPNSEETAEKFLTQEFRQSWGYQQHIESQMVNHLRFYVTLLLGLISAAIAISRFGASPTFPTLGLVGLLFLGFWFVGQVLRQVYLELRIRKMLAIEDLNSIREYFNKQSSIISEYGAFPTRRIESPSFLRKGSAEWYTLVFMAFANSSAAGTCLYLTNRQWGWASSVVSQLHWPILIPICGALFLLEFSFSTLKSYKYDLKRRKRIGHSQYELLELKDRSIVEIPLVKLGECLERGYRKKLIRRIKREHNKKRHYFPGEG